MLKEKCTRITPVHEVSQPWPGGPNCSAGASTLPCIPSGDTQKSYTNEYYSHIDHLRHRHNMSQGWGQVQ